MYQSKLVREYMIIGIAKQIADAIPAMKSAEIAQNAKDYVARLEDTIADIKLDYTNWIVSDIVLDNNKVIPKHLEQKIKNNFDWYIRAACVSLIL